MPKQVEKKRLMPRVCIVHKLLSAKSNKNRISSLQHTIPLNQFKNYCLKLNSLLFMHFITITSIFVLISLKVCDLRMEECIQTFECLNCRNRSFALRILVQFSTIQQNLSLFSLIQLYFAQFNAIQQYSAQQNSIQNN